MRTPFRRALTVVFILVGPTFTACEAVLDFDRSPLQPEYEAGPPDAGSSTSSDATPDRGSTSTTDAGEGGTTPPPVDAGNDARSDADAA